jgi:DNA-directed RNA polymerase subunit beta'
MTEVDGVVRFEDLVEASRCRDTDERPASPSASSSTGASSSPGADLKPAIVMREDGKMLKLARGGDARYLLPVDAISRSIRTARSRRATSSPVSRAKAPRPATSPAVCRASPNCSRPVAEGPRDHRRRSPARSSFGKDYKNKRRIIDQPRGRRAGRVPDPEGQAHHPSRKATSSEGRLHHGRQPGPHDILRIKGVEALANYLVNEIQDVYRLQGVKINDKHIEVIVRQMLQKVEITRSGRHHLLKGEQVDQGRVRRRSTPRRSPKGKKPGKASRCCSASPRRRCRPSRSSRRRRSRRPPACSPRRSVAARSTRWRPEGKRHRRPPDPGRHVNQREGPSREGGPFAMGVFYGRP